MGALTWARLSYRQQRWELLLILLGAVGAAAAMIWFAGSLTGLQAANPDCVSSVAANSETGPPAACQSFLTAYYDAQGMASTLLALSAAAPFGVGVLLGAPLVAREIDGGTAQLAWSLSRSRVSWLVRRFAFIAAFTVVLLGALAVTSETLAQAMSPDRDLSTDFAWLGSRGPLIVARGVGALMIAMLVGAVIGRVLPSVLAAGFVVAVAFTGMTFAQDAWLDGQAEVFRSNVLFQGPSADPGVLYVGGGLELVSGEVVAYEQLRARGIDAEYGDEHGRMFASQADMLAERPLGYEVVFVIPGSRYGEVVAVVGAASVALGLAALLATGVVVSRRRPV